MSVGYAVKTINPTRVVVIFDGKDGSSKRKAIFPDYKAKRKVKIRLNRSLDVDSQDTQLLQLFRLIEYLEIMPITTITIDKSEADDVIAYIANNYLKNKDSNAYIMSSDKDFMQLVDDRIKVWSPTKKKMFEQQDVQADFGVCPQNFALYRSLIGDTSDNIPGVVGLGAPTLLEKFPDLSTQPMTLDQFFDYARVLAADSKAKIYQKVLQAESDVRMYYEIIQLNDSNINTSNKIKIMDSLESEVPKLSNIKFHTMLLQDGMTATIKNPELWLREVTKKLDQHSLNI